LLDVKVMFDRVGSIEHFRAGKLRPLGVPGFESSPLDLVSAFRRAPPPQIIEKLNREINADLADPRIKPRLADLGADAFGGISDRKWPRTLRARPRTGGEAVKFSAPGWISATPAALWRAGRCIAIVCSAMMRLAMDLDQKTRTELEAAAFRHLLQHLRTRTDVQNIDLMNLAGFCRNCLSNWMKEAADQQGVPMSKDESRQAVYGMPYDEWRSKYQKEASPEQKASFDKAAHRH
jgi:hypothetical protein